MAVPSWAQTYLDMINGNGTNQFFWYNWNTSTNENPYDCTFNGTIASDYSWRNLNNITDVTVTNAIIYQTNYTQTIQVVERATVNINGSGDSYSISQSLTGQNILQSYRYSKTTYQTNFVKVVNSKYQGFVSNSASGTIQNLSYTGTLENCLKYLTNNIKNCNIYVNGEYWSGPDEPPAPVYNWQSVPSISGKNGILQSLVQIKEEALNDGEPVSEATVLSFDSLGNINIPSVINQQMPVDPTDITAVTAAYLIPALENGIYNALKLLIKKGSIPTDESDADKVVNIDEPTSFLRIGSKSVENLDEDSHYYFMVKVEDELGTVATSDPKDIWTSHSEADEFGYTGEIVEWTVPKTGIYLLEAWGAQGGNAQNESIGVLGGYGSYSKGEVLLTQGEKLYIAVGGQNGYNGGGKVVVTQNIQPSVCNTYFESTVDYDWLPYRDSAYCIWYGDINKGRFVADGGKMTYYNPMVNSESHFWIPLQAHRHVKTIKFKYRKVRAGGDITYLWFRCLLQNRDDEGHVTDQVIVVDDLTGATTDEISVNYECDIIADYVHLMTCDGEVYVKDLQIIYETT